jgi:LAO/AO transport system kinase
VNTDVVLAAKDGCRRSLARTLSALENNTLDIADALSIIGEINSDNHHDSTWKIMAITGAPGVGKSCLVDKIISQWASQGKKIALLAVDPSSSRTGGALLGDRVRLSVVDDILLKDMVYVRSVATRKSSSSVPSVVSDMAKLLLALGWHKIVIETVGAGQSEVRCAAIADIIVVVEGPARGDGIQAEKAGLLELADAVIVNKSDMVGARKHADEIKQSFELGDGQIPPVLLTSAITGDGCQFASDVLLTLQSTGRSSKARWRERLLAGLEQRVLQNPHLDSVLLSLAAGSIELDDALNKLNN